MGLKMLQGNQTNYYQQDDEHYIEFGHNHSQLTVKSNGNFVNIRLAALEWLRKQNIQYSMEIPKS